MERKDGSSKGPRSICTREILLSEIGCLLCLLGLLAMVLKGAKLIVPKAARGLGSSGFWTYIRGLPSHR